MLIQIFLALTGICSGIVVSGGMIGLIIGLSITPRYAGVTRTADSILLYEDCMMYGAILGNLFYLFGWKVPIGNWGAGGFGIFAGIFVGSWILALAEMADVFPILTRRIKLTAGMPFIIASVAAGKVLGALYYFYKGW